MKKNEKIISARGFSFCKMCKKEKKNLKKFTVRKIQLRKFKNARKKKLPKKLAKCPFRNLKYCHQNLPQCGQQILFSCVKKFDDKNREKDFLFGAIFNTDKFKTEREKLKLRENSLQKSASMNKNKNQFMLRNTRKPEKNLRKKPKTRFLEKNV